MIMSVRRKDRPIPGLAEALKEMKSKHGDPFAPIRHYLKYHLGVDHLDLTGDDDPSLYDLFQTEFGMTPAETGRLTPTLLGRLLTVLHQLRTAPTEDARNHILTAI